MDEAPTPKVEYETNLEPIELESNSNKFKVHLSFTSLNMSFLIEHINSFPKKEYFLSKSLNEYQKIDKFFNYFDNTKEIMTYIKDSLKDKSLNILISENKCDLEIKNPITKSVFKLSIPKKEQSIKDELATIIPYIEALKSRIEKLESENSELKQKVEFLIQKEEQRENLEKEKENKIFNMFKESTLLKPDDKKLIYNFLQKKPKSTILLYDSDIDGDSAKAFHSKCDEKYQTIYIVKSQKGRTFGGYLSQAWKSSNNYFEDNEAFFFSIDLKKKYDFSNKKEVYIGNPGYGPVIRGGINMVIQNDGKNSKYNLIFLENSNNSYEINGERDFKLEKYEVFQLEF